MILFIVKEDTGRYIATDKEEIDSLIKRAEESGSEINFTTVAKVERPTTIDFPVSAIEFFTEEEKENSEEIVNAIITYLI